MHRKIYQKFSKMSRVILKSKDSCIEMSFRWLEDSKIEQKPRVKILSHNREDCMVAWIKYITEKVPDKDKSYHLVTWIVTLLPELGFIIVVTLTDLSMTISMIALAITTVFGGGRITAASAPKHKGIWKIGWTG